MSGIRRPISADHDRTVYRVQWVSRADIGEPDRPEGFQDFDTLAEARAWFRSDEVQRRGSAYWRVEIQVRGPWNLVESIDYAEEETDG